eukprot:766322-Hanusia_phi.AAC.1
MYVNILQSRPPVKRRAQQVIRLSGESLENLEDLAKRANCLYSKRSKRAGEPDVNSFLKGLGTSPDVPFPTKSFEQVWDEISTELHLPADNAKPKHSGEIHDEEAKKLFDCKFQTVFRSKCEQLLHEMLKFAGGSFKTHEEQWKLFGNLFNEGTGDKQTDKFNRFMYEKVFLGLAGNKGFKEFLPNKIRTDQHAQNKLKFIVKSFLPDVNESCTLTLKANMSKNSYNTYWREIPRTHRLAVPMRKIGNCRVMKKIWLKKALKVFRTEQKCWGADLQTSVKLKAVQDNLHRKKVLILVFNTDATVLTKSTGCETKHTEVSFTLLTPLNQCVDAEERKEMEKRVRQALDAVTLMVLPVGDNAKNMKFNFWEPYEKEIVSLLKNGLQIENNDMEVVCFFRADLAGHNGLLEQGGVSDASGKFCIHCEETSESKRAGNFMFLSENNAQDGLSLRQFAERYTLNPSDIELMNSMVKVSVDLGSVEMIDLSSTGAEQLLGRCVSPENQQKLSKCFEHPDMLMPDNVVLPCLKLCKISRECKHLKDAQFKSLHFIYCSLHLKLRFVNLLLNYVYEVAANKHKVAAVNRILQRFHVNMELKNDRDQQRQLNGKMCKRFMNAFPAIMDLLLPDSDDGKRQEWKVAIDDWNHIIQVLSCQYYDKISATDAKQLPTRIRSFCVKLINLVGDVKRLQSFYFHSMLVGHIGEQFTYLYEEFGIPIGLLSLSPIEKRHEAFGR